MLQQASVTGFIRTILIIILIYYGLKVLSRLFAPLLLKYIAKKAEQKFGGQFQQGPQQPQPKKKGEVTIDKIPNTKTSNKDVGEYVDYEEID
ncbi:DUF4834 family protein [Mariniflexile litorale]|uniref:DUF4834 family protein n=1 Tax=Mariniflexile litorale TaxID=3045158 RepID=A0AAU7EFE4_9FLAO|nr:DUF4834 family protein [Mariniflexile sp. KMM 9835]MDQ8213139.1 DUF4834 family protein [Mariniflexile sp. KMM 9835]